MAKYVKTDYVPDSVEYLTVNKEYEVEDDEWIIDDVGDLIHIHAIACPHLDWRAWTVINR